MSETQAQYPLVDTHCHLDFHVFNTDRDAIVSEARSQGVTKILNPGIDLLTSQAIVQMASDMEGVFAAVGVHPNESTGWDEESYAHLEQLARKPKVVAIGEIGLDFYRDRAPKDIQRRVFQHQLELARSVGLPVIIHTRQSIHETFDYLEDWIASLKVYNQLLAAQPGVFHSFSGNEEDARRVIDLGFFIGITGPVTFKNAPALQKLVAGLPVERILIETDAPFLSPHPHRGDRNRPAWVRLIAEKIAELKHLPLEDAAKITTANANRLFSWSDGG